MAMEVWWNLDGVNWFAVVSEPDGSYRVKTMLEYEGAAFDVASYEYRPGLFVENTPLTTPRRFRARDYNEYRAMNVNEAERDADRDRVRLERAQSQQAQWDRQQAEAATPPPPKTPPDNLADLP